MNANEEVTFWLARRKLRDCDPEQIRDPDSFIPRIARLMALAIRLEGLVRDESFQNYAELAQLGRVTRARMSQITKLLQLAPDLQEQILFLPPLKGLNERNLRAVVQQLDWSKQRRIFEKMIVTRTEDGPESI
jgi:hypothetical protein